MTDVIESTAEDFGTELAVQQAPPPALFGTDDPVEVVQAATRVADALKDVIVAKGLFTNVQGKAHVNVEGWQLLGSMLGVTAVCTGTEQIDGGFKATVEARTADGRVVGRADALCTKHEKRGPWKNADDYARLSMAQTRATSKALKGPLGFVISLAGYATTPAEEMTFAEPDDAGRLQATPDAKPARKITKKRAEQLVSTAADLDVLDTLPLAAGHVTGREFPTDPDGLLDAIRGLSTDEADRLDTWLEKKEQEATS